jgi:hypothetical protein
MTERIRAYDRQIEDLCQSRYPETKGLRQVGGVGALTSLAYILSLEDPARFRKSREVGPFLGMVPRRGCRSAAADHPWPRPPACPGSPGGRQDRRRLLAAPTLDCPPSLPWQSRGQAGGQRPVHPRALRSRLPVPGTGATCAAGD